MTDPFLLLGPGAVAALLTGHKTQTRLIAGSPLGECRPGDRLWIKEPFLAGRGDAGGRGVSVNVRAAAYAVFPDGWRRYRDGSGHGGDPPNNRKLRWMPAVHMPRWASRAEVVIESLRTESLQSISLPDVRAEGLRPIFGGLLWRWPGRSLWRDPRCAFAAHWNIHHATPGERWEDDPQVIVLGFRVEAPQPLA